MRDEFVRVLTQLARTDKDVILMTGDLGFGVLAKFAEEFPSQFINAGIAEQNMTGMATGMALEGKTVFTYSIGNFTTLRCLEQIRNDACYHGANVKIVSVGGGFSYGSLGISHHATEDLAIMRSLPDITIFAPGDVVEAGEITRVAYQTPGTCYLRLGRGGEPTVHKDKINLIIGKAIKIYDGFDAIFISTGGILKNVVEACEQLKRQGVDIGLYSMPSIKPFDKNIIQELAYKTPLIVTVEEHTIIGGLGSSVAEVLAQLQNPKAQLKMIGLQDCFSSIVGDQDYLREIYGLSVKKIAEVINQFNTKK